jgi:nicotianamine synthase
VLKDARIARLLPSLRNLAAVGETHLESHWAAHVIAAENEAEGNPIALYFQIQNSNKKSAYSRLVEFPYYENYVDLTRMELSAISAVNPIAPQRVAFIGSGPLPLTSLCICEALRRIQEAPASNLAAALESTIVNIDHNINAISQSAALCKKLGHHARGMGFICQDAESLEFELSSCDVVFLAALVGATQAEKEIALTSIVDRMRPGSLLVIRTAHSLRTLLYPVSYLSHMP